MQEPLYQDVDDDFEEHEFHQNNIVDVMTKLSGVILRKAEFEDDFDKVYTFVFEKIASLNSGEDFLAILGEIGG